jgi:ATP-dependent DNA ligase
MPADQLRSLPKTKAAFVEPMDCLPVPKLPEGSQWVWEIKLDGYRAVAVKSGGAVTLYSRNRKILNKRFPYIAEPLRGLPDGTVVDGEIVALDDHGRPVFNLLQNFTSESGRIRYFVFDLLGYKNRDLTRLSLLKRREMLRSLKFDGGRIAISEYIEASAEQMLSAVKAQRLEGVVGKRKDSVYEPGKRSGAWIKHRVNLGQEFVIGGFTPGPHGLDAIIVGYYRGDDLVYVARTRNGFVPASRRGLKLNPRENNAHWKQARARLCTEDRRACYAISNRYRKYLLSPRYDCILGLPDGRDCHRCYRDTQNHCAWPGYGIDAMLYDERGLTATS